ncbi:MAG: DegT/DnrJ/EryC1/StrS family aminotransferase [Prevotellaceae bacterium]|jgi:dTDP-4-amino-4,6-dideoxygalactose transaminase|nr:DegT/DnrJ/EryC1/StrS family aminotransferase [Prevotellaceae bacterium]
MKNIQMVDLKSQYEKIKVAVDKGIQEVIDSTAFIKGGKVVEFQQELENYLNVKHVIPVGNGTDALQIALMALDLQPGDELIAPAFTFIATAEVVALLGLTPVLVDVDYHTHNISIDALKKAITPKTKAIVPVHLFGLNVDMEDLLAVAKEYNLYVIEDACQSIGAVYTFSDGRQVQSGCMGDVGCTSFFPSKNLGCYGDGGAIFTNNDDLAKKMRSIANHGMETRYHHDRIGVNSRLDSIQAAVLQVKLNFLNEYIAARQAVAAYYDTAFSNTDKLITPGRTASSTHVFHQYTLKLQNVDREKLQAYLKEKGIPSMVYYPIPLHVQKAYRSSKYKIGDFPVAEALSATVLSLPMHTELSSEQLEYITRHVLAFVENKKA